jgi:hypothetical protein
MSSQSFLIDQTLHGYSHGHKELASSISLDSESHSAMLDLSDLLVARGKSPANGYLTAYPLKKAQRHVFSRTWLAGPNQRPGSVWTHSLILDFKTLSFLDDLGQLLRLFRYPSDGSYNSYADQVQFSEERLLGTAIAKTSADPRARAALTALYGENAQDKIVLPSIPEFDEDLAIAVWRQMWPSLRRDFAFLTGPTSKSVTFGASCSLQFLLDPYEIPPADPDLESDPGIALLMQDLWQPGPTQLRDLLGRYVIEAPNARQLAPKVASLLTANDVSADVRVRNVKLLSKLAPFQRLVRDTLAEELVRAEGMEHLLILVSEFKNEPVLGSLTNIIAPLAQREASEIAQLLSACQPSTEHQFGDLVFSTIVAQADSNRLATASAQLHNQRELVKDRPDIADKPTFWPQEDADRAAIIRSARLKMPLARAEKLFAPPFGPELSAAILESAPPADANEVLKLYHNIDPVAARYLAQWLVAHRHALKLLTHQSISLGGAMLELLCGAELEVNGSPKSPILWQDMIIHSSDARPGSIGPATLVVGFLSSLALPATEGLPLVKLVFDPLYALIEEHRLGFEMERHLNNGINSSLRSWSTSRTIVLAVILHWHKGGVRPEALGIASSHKSLKAIVEELVSRFGHSACQTAFASPKANDSARRAISAVYKPKSKKSSFLFWEW